MPYNSVSCDLPARAGLGGIGLFGVHSSIKQAKLHTGML
jgi:hypothetical protein